MLLAARTLNEHVTALKLGRFELMKRLPVGAGLGGGSSDAAAALRLLAKLNGLELRDPRVLTAARKTGADVTVCLEEKARVMSGIGEKLSPPAPTARASLRDFVSGGQCRYARRVRGIRRAWDDFAFGEI